jgi:hypothetical protein
LKVAVPSFARIELHICAASLPALGGLLAAIETAGTHSTAVPIRRNKSFRTVSPLYWTFAVPL